MAEPKPDLNGEQSFSARLEGLTGNSRCTELKNKSLPAHRIEVYKHIVDSTHSFYQVLDTEWRGKNDRVVTTYRVYGEQIGVLVRTDVNMPPGDGLWPGPESALLSAAGAEMRQEEFFQGTDKATQRHRQLLAELLEGGEVVHRSPDLIHEAGIQETD